MANQVLVTNLTSQSLHLPVGPTIMVIPADTQIFVDRDFLNQNIVDFKRYRLDGLIAFNELSPNSLGLSIGGATGPQGATGVGTGGNFLPLAGGTLTGPLVIDGSSSPTPLTVITELSGAGNEKKGIVVTDSSGIGPSGTFVVDLAFDTASDGPKYIAFRNANGESWIGIDSNSQLNIGTTGAQPVEFWTSNNLRMVVDPQGQVKIGEGDSASLPTADLLVSQNDDAFHSIVVKNSQVEGVIGAGTSGSLNAFYIATANPDARMQFGIGLGSGANIWSTPITIDTSGTVWVGVDPGAPMFGQHNPDAQAMIVQGFAGQSVPVMEIRRDDGTTMTTVDNDGKMKIGDGLPSINGTADLLISKNEDVNHFIALKNANTEGFLYVGTSAGLNPFQIGTATPSRIQFQINNGQWTPVNISTEGGVSIGVDPGAPTVGQHDPGVPALTVQGTSGQSVPVFEIRKDDGTTVISVDNDGTVHLASKSITNVADPTDPQDVATKNYVDSSGTVSADGPTSGLVVVTTNTVEQQRVTFNSDSGGSLNGTYWLFNTRANSYYVWYTNGTGVDPSVPGRIGVQVVFVDNDVFGIIRDKTRDTLAGASSGDFTISDAGFPSTNHLQINDVSFGYVPLARDVSTGFGILEIQSGGIKNSLSIRAFPSPLDMGSNPIQNVADPTNPQDVATKNYVDSASSPVVATVSLSAQTTDISGIVYTPSSSGMYQVSVYVVVSNGDGAALSQPTTSIGWNDGVSSTGAGTIPLDLSGTGNFVNLVAPFYAVFGQDITYNVNHGGGAPSYGSATYNIYISVLKL